MDLLEHALATPTPGRHRRPPEPSWWTGYTPAELWRVGIFAVPIGGAGIMGLYQLLTGRPI